MSEQKIEEKSNEKDTKSYLLQLNERDLRMMELKLFGLKYKDIAITLTKEGYGEVTEPIIKKAFSINGNLKDVFDEYKKNRLEEIESESLDLAKAHLKTAFECLISVMGQRENQGPRVSAATAVIERILGKPMNVNYNFNQQDYDNENDEIKKLLEERRKKRLEEEEAKKKEEQNG